MTEQDISRYQDLIVTTATDVGIKILAAIAFWVIGRWLIGMVLSMVRASLEKQKVDPTVLRYLGSVITVTLNVLLVVGILGYFCWGFSIVDYYGLRLSDSDIDVFVLFVFFRTCEAFDAPLRAGGDRDGEYGV